MLPTPSKFHYIFNLRDLSRIWQGMLHIQADECNTIPVLLALFKNECTRVIADRYISPEHQKKNRQISNKHLTFFFQQLSCCRFISNEDREWFEVATNAVIEENIEAEFFAQLHPEPYFVDFLRDAPEPTGEEEDDACLDAPKIYELVQKLIFI